MKHDIVLLRRKHHLRQEDLAQLVGVSQTTVARLEARDATAYAIRLEWALALQVVFGASPARIYLHDYQRIEDEVMRRAAEFERTLDGQHDQPSQYKRALLSDMVRRATNARHP